MRSEEEDRDDDGEGESSYLGIKLFLWQKVEVSVACEGRSHCHLAVQ